MVLLALLLGFLVARGLIADEILLFWFGEGQRRSRGRVSGCCSTGMRLIGRRVSTLL